MGTPLTGVHVFEKRGQIEWEGVIAALQLLSALSWKQHHGKIELYTNTAWLETLDRYGVSEVYDKINTTELAKSNPEIDHSRYWSWPKLHIARRLTRSHVMLDTDLWITAPLQIDQTKDFIGFHEETWSSSDPATPYPDFDILLEAKNVGRWDKGVLPINCALMWFNNTDLLHEWLDTAERVALAKETLNIEDPARVIHAVFVEQRLLPMVAKELGLSCGTFLPLVYQTHVDDTGLGECWVPNPTGWTERQRLKIETFKHIWGCKRLWAYDQNLKNHQFRVIASELHRFASSYNVEPALSAVISQIS